MEIAEIDLYVYGLSIFDNGAEPVLWRKRSVFSKWYWNNGIAICQNIDQ